MEMIHKTKKISIHAPRGGSDAKTLTSILPVVLISIHAPRGGSDSSLGDTAESN